MDESTHLEEVDLLEVDEGALLETDMHGNDFEDNCFYTAADDLYPMWIEITICMMCGHAVVECACEECVCSHLEVCGVCCE